MRLLFRFSSMASIFLTVKSHILFQFFDLAFHFFSVNRRRPWRKCLGSRCCSRKSEARSSCARHIRINLSRSLNKRPLPLSPLVISFSCCGTTASCDRSGHLQAIELLVNRLVIFFVDLIFLLERYKNRSCSIPPYKTSRS